MIDYFALLKEARRPWIDPDTLKARFVELSSEFHPDRVHHHARAERDGANQRYLELNAAYRCLRHSKERLAHLLELERGSKPQDVQAVPSSMVEWFMEVSQLCRAADAFLSKASRAASPLLQVQLLETGLKMTESLEVLQKKLETRLNQLGDQLKTLNMAWETAPAVGSPTRIHVLPCSRLEHIYHELSHFSRWAQQAHERVVRLEQQALSFHK